MRKRSEQIHGRESSATLQLTVSLLYHPYPKPLAKSARLVYNQIRKPKDIGVSNGCTIGNL